ncbi:Luciferase-like monooxygenase [Alteracholeplasma palmae J233]|uniref:Luciferase-like monooxygenase n=1 Tax=Alteracholeplasma palmae (strain ATCC 49389 / J233) TaxID=1318466 RepID=U4KJJ6_ALTPJ|nr:LLM class flavin-dependent oxidoreductase [Alteracholeplasma palmae]CCV63629.1 Luciferase-like monooxygenase [Alteracholeplasma palmae J233]
MINMEFGLYSLGDYVTDAKTGNKVTEQERIEQIIEAAKLAEQYGLDIFSLGESHQEHFISQAHAVILAAIARETKKIRISSSATIISTSDPVRVYENFATLDLLSNGRAEITAGRASRVGLFKLLGYDLRDYETLFEEKFELLLKLFKEDKITWSGQFRAPLSNMELFPKPLQKDFPIWRAVGGTLNSALMAARQGVPMTMATLAGPVSYFNQNVKAYRTNFLLNHPDKEPKVAIDTFLYVGETDEEAFRNYYQYANHSLKMANGQGLRKEAYVNTLDIRDVMLVGSVDTIVKKIVYQYETYKHQRHLFQIDLGGMPFEEVKRMIKIIGEQIVPQVKEILSKEN